MFWNLFGRSNSAPCTDTNDIERPGALPISRKPHEEAVVIELLPEIEEQVKKLPLDKQDAARKKIDDFKDAIQPHTDEGGDAYYIGDAHDPVSPKCVEEWSENQDKGEYLTYVEAISKKLKHLEYLALWMLVGCSPPKWRFLKGQEKSRNERITRTNVRVTDYSKTSAVNSEPFTSTEALKDFLTATPDGFDVRLVIAEDLSRDLIELLGVHYDVDPLFFLSHIGDYLFHNPRDRWVELPDLEVDAKKRSHFNIQYLRPRYFKSEDEYNEAEKQSGYFNVLRRLDSDRSRKSLQRGLLDKPEASVTLSRAKSSLWIKPRAENEPIVAILLVDPSVKAGQPIWGGYRPFDNTPSMAQWKQMKGDAKNLDSPPRTSLFDDVVYWSAKLTEEDLKLVKQDPTYLALPMYKLIIADWLVVLKYMTTMFGVIEWSFAKPHWGESPADIDELLKKLSPWRRNIHYYQQMVDDAITRLFPDIAIAFPTTPANLVVSAPTTSGVYSLWPDFKNIKHQMDAHSRRIVSIQTMATNAINTEEARRAVKQNRNLARLSFLATFFIPLNFTSSFLSMSPDFPTRKNYTTIWLFFAVGIPITLFAFLVVDWMRPNEKGFSRRLWNHYKPKKNDKVPGTGAEVKPAVRPTNGMRTRASTMGWLERERSS